MSGHLLAPTTLPPGKYTVYKHCMGSRTGQHDVQQRNIPCFQQAAVLTLWFSSPYSIPAELSRYSIDLLYFVLLETDCAFFFFGFAGKLVSGDVTCLKYI
jgi:hypothetical protein